MNCPKCGAKLIDYICGKCGFDLKRDTISCWGAGSKISIDALTRYIQKKDAEASKASKDSLDYPLLINQMIADPKPVRQSLDNSIDTSKKTKQDEDDLYVRIGERISKELSKEELEEFDSIKNTTEAGKWLAIHAPNYISIVEEERAKFLQEKDVRQTAAQRHAAEMADRYAANAVMEQIHSIGRVDSSKECGQRIQDARDAFKRLTPYRQEMVTNRNLLVDAEARYAFLLQTEQKKKERRAKIEYVQKDKNRNTNNAKRTRRIIYFAFAALLLCVGVFILCKSVLFSDMAKPLSSSFFASAKQGDVFTLGKYEQDNNHDNGAEDIEWVVVDVDADKGVVLAMSKYVLDCKPYAENEYINTDWEHCSLREWLNGEFYESSFSDDDKQWIRTVCHQNRDGMGYETPGGYNTVDHVFLLDRADLRTLCDDVSYQLGGLSESYRDVRRKEIDSSLPLLADYLGELSYIKNIIDVRQEELLSSSNILTDVTDDCFVVDFFSTSSVSERLKATFTPYAKEAYIRQQMISKDSAETEEKIREDYAELEKEYGELAADWWLSSPGKWLDQTMIVSWPGIATSMPSRDTSRGVRPVIAIASITSDRNEENAQNEEQNENVSDLLSFPEASESSKDDYSFSHDNYVVQWVEDDQKALFILKDGSVRVVSYDTDYLSSVSDWKNIKKVAIGSGVVVGITNDGKIQCYAEHELSYDLSTLMSLTHICDVCICDAINPKNPDYSGLIICFSDEGTVYRAYAGGYNAYWNDSCKAICASGNQFFILHDDGTVSGRDWESNPLVEEWNDIVQIACGDTFVAGLKSDGTVVVDGSCVFPALTGVTVLKGDGTFGKIDELFEVSNWKGIISISAGSHHLVGLKSDGTVVAVGLNYYGQCDTFEERLWTDIVRIEASGNMTVGFASDGSVVIAGKNIVDNVIDLKGKWNFYRYYSR